MSAFRVYMFMGLPLAFEVIQKKSVYYNKSIYLEIRLVFEDDRFMQKERVRPVLETGTIILCPYEKKDIAALEGVQNKFTRKLFLRSYHMPYPQIPIGDQCDKTLGLNSLESGRDSTQGPMIFGLRVGDRPTEG
ncbi:hypothetical protein OESDEN_00258 [Oesophagostomum dentatum]|uniref:Uncharacterized protein n=1 Tax=Oesophagostomum dentatum TaxID=61180 RepID=A0A0B1TR70_OESDE|nr:hypothetical protein OESDEN_00258 [Oesophagostomum dentatum]